MSTALSQTLVVGISSTALFDLEEADRRFRKWREEDPDMAIERCREYVQEREDEPLEPGIRQWASSHEGSSSAQRTHIATDGDAVLFRRGVNSFINKKGWTNSTSGKTPYRTSRSPVDLKKTS